MKLPAGLKYIEYSAFRGCKDLCRIRLPNGLQTIGASCFQESGLKEVSLPSSVRHVYPYAFKDCVSMQRVHLNEGLQTLGAKRCLGGTDYEGEAFAGSAVEDITIPSTVKTIEANTFYRCERLKNVKFAGGLKKICLGAF